ncbi:terminase small subunit [Pontimicrobium aquaticum]|uniref:Terminase small subunit n=1 Tax=Pontimicrobium aquaticum TaxID=2565367 RepID=A0A4U0F1D2_9FLAO|nr:terminase small subunit [Pontimicrobium aquaticum]TJY38203.1 hypothetical protein E5167_02815 [Pontimicrobium aquaticum]
MKKQKKPLKDLYKNIIDQYFLNGFNGIKAVRTVKGSMYNYNSAASLFNTVIKHTDSIAYIQAKREALRSSVSIKNEDILKELINWAYSDITDYILLTPSELKQLPEDLKRCIQSATYKKKKYVTRQGEEVEEEVMTVKLVDKSKALEMINKHLGFYLEDNKQKSNPINIERLSVDTLNALLQAIE